MSALAPTLEAFFTDRLLTQRQVSPRTVAAYRDTLRLLLGFAQQRTGTPPCRLDLADLNADLVAAFLTHLERDRGNGVRTRNARLGAIHSLFRYAALRHPEHAESIARVLADIHEGDKINEKALKALIRAAAELNMSARAARSRKKSA